MGHTETDNDIATFEAAVKPLISELELLDDDEGLAAGLRLMGYITMDRYADATAYYERALVHAERAGNQLDAVRAAASLGFLALFGPVPVTEAIERCHELRDRVAGHRGATASLLRFEAVLVAMRGGIDKGRALHDAADDIMEDLGAPSMSAAKRPSRARSSSSSPAHPCAPSMPRAPAWRPSRPWATATRDRPRPRSSG